MNEKDEELVLFATAVAMKLAQGLDIEELNDLRNLINQISCSLTTLINHKHCVLNKKNNQP